MNGLILLEEAEKFTTAISVVDKVYLKDTIGIYNVKTNAYSIIQQKTWGTTK